MKIQSKATNSQTIIAEDVAINGDMILSGNLTIYGEIKGSVKTDGAVQLAKSGKIYGDVEASMIQINGYIEGDAFINGPAELLKGCELVGNLKYKVLTIAAPGAYFVDHLRSSGFPSDELEYSFSFLSAFDPEGLATIDYVDSQDDTRIKKSGDTVQGALVFDQNKSILEIAGDTGKMDRRYVKVRGNNQFEILAYPGQDNNGSKVAFKLESWTDGNPDLTLNYIKDPTSNGHAVNKRYGDANYYPFTGGSITGDVTIENASFYVKDGSGNETFRIQPNGFCRTSDLFRAQRDDGGPALQARIDTTLNAEIRCDGKSSFKGEMNMNSNKITNVATPTSNNDAANKKYVDDNVGTAAPIKTGTSSNPSLKTGELYFNTSSKQLFVGT